MTGEYGTSGTRAFWCRDERKTAVQSTQIIMTALMIRWRTALKQVCGCFSKSDLPTAIYCANDEIAVGLLNAAITCKLKVPEDISIIGHDGSLYSEISCPRLTTVSIQPYEIGRTCMEQVYHQICGKKVSDVRVVEPKLIEGESVKKLI